MLVLAAIVVVHTLINLARKLSLNPAAPQAVMVHEEQHSTLSWQQLFRSFERLLRKPEAASPLTAAELSPLRATYRGLLTWAARGGRAREPSTTPRELAAHLSMQYPEKSRALSELTDLYTKERYAERRCTDEEQKRARTLLNELTR